MGDLIQVSGIGAGGWKIAQNAGQSLATDNLEGGAIGSVWSGQNSVGNSRFVASSADGTRLVAAGFPGQLLTSTDSGVTWTARESNRLWSSVASSADGTRLVAVDNTVLVYTSTPTPMHSTSTGVAGAISARQYDAIDLQYAGNGVFLVRGSAGVFNVQ